MRRLPRRVHLGRAYAIAIHLKPARWFRERYGESLAGTFEPCLGRPGPVAGHIYIRANMTPAARHATYWHELLHAINDIAAWDGHRVRT